MIRFTGPTVPPDHKRRRRFQVACAVPALALTATAHLGAQSAPAAGPRPLAGLIADGVTGLPVGALSGRRSRPYYSSKGPWGTLLWFHAFIEAPRAMVNDFPLPNPKPRWTFTASQARQLPELLRKAGLDKSFTEALLDPVNRIANEDLVHVFPPLDGIRAMTPGMREVIYPELAKVPANEFYVDPVLITTDTVDEWYAGSKLRPEVVANIRGMAYMRGKCLAFSDLAAIMNDAGSESEAREIFKACTRTRTLLAKLELREGETNIGEIMDYWTTGLNLRRKDIEPILQSVLDTDEMEHLDLVHLLPALVRKLLYTYPDPSMFHNGILPDCHWTSLNFFNYEPHDYLLDSRLATSSVLEKFRQIDPPYHYGDLLFFINTATGDAFHSCVYLADNIVYTKNGRNVVSPWVLMSVADLEKIYLHDGNGRIQGYRHKQAAGGILNQ